MTDSSQPMVQNSLRELNPLFDFYRTDTISSKDLKKYKDYTIEIINDFSFGDIPSPEHEDTSLLIRLDYESKFKVHFVQFFKDLFKLIEDSKPSIPTMNNGDHYQVAAKDGVYDNNHGKIPLYGGHLRENYLVEPIRTEGVLNYYFRIDNNELNSLKDSHKKFTSSMILEYPEDLFKFGIFNKFMKGNGIVYLGGDDYNQLALISIKMLRSMGSILPIELIVPKESDFDIELCNSILPTLNASCKVMSHFLPKSVMEHVNGYQMKNIALLISSFENVLYLDADNIPLKNPDNLFTNEPFISDHMILWPDLWRRSTSPKYYEIADIEVDKDVRVRNSYFPEDNRGKNQEKISYHDSKGTLPEASSETGQILINKRVHLKTLILAMYYNYFGPGYYYPLFSQGAAGEGDKETFIAAAHKLGLSFYQVNEFVREFGPLNGKNKHEFYGMGQYDPLIDSIQNKNFDKNFNSDFKPDYAVDSGDADHLNYNFHYFKSSDLMFLHANWPKYKLHEMYMSNSFGRGPKSGDGRRRLYDSNIMGETSGRDVELLIAKSIDWLYCEVAVDIKKVPEPELEDRAKICAQIKEQVFFLSTTK